MNCEQLQEKLSEYLEWSLDRATDDAVESHLSACLICGGEAEALRQGIQSVADLPSVKPPPGFSQRIMAHVREEAQRPGLWECIVHPISIKIPIQATALILVGVLAVLVYRTNQPVERETVKSMPAVEVLLERRDLPDKKDRVIPAIPSSSSSSRITLLEDQVKSLDEVLSGELRRAEEEMLELGRALGLRMRRELSNEPLGPADFVLVFTPRKSLKGAKVL